MLGHKMLGHLTPTIHAPSRRTRPLSRSMTNPTLNPEAPLREGNVKMAVIQKTRWGDGLMRRLWTCRSWVEKGSIALHVIFCSLITAGCGTAGLCIVDVEKSSVIFRRESGRYRESPLYVTQEGFRTLQRTETNSYILRTVGFDGKEVSQINLSLFTAACGTDSYAFSDDGMRLAYVKQKPDRNNQIYVSSITNVTENLLPTGEGENMHARLISVILWVNSDVFLFFPNNGPRMEKDPIYLIRLDERKSTQLDSVASSYGPTLLSPSKRYLLVSEGINNTLRYRLIVFDLSGPRKIFMIEPPGMKMHAWGAVWSSNDELMYAVDNVVYAQKVGSQEKVEVLRLKQSYGAWLYAVDSRRNLHYQIYDRDSSSSRQIGGWRTFNLDTKEDNELTGHQINGKVRMTRERDIIVAEVGY